MLNAKVGRTRIILYASAVNPRTLPLVPNRTTGSMTTRLHGHLLRHRDFVQKGRLPLARQTGLFIEKLLPCQADVVALSIGRKMNREPFRISIVL